MTRLLANDLLLRLPGVRRPVFVVLGIVMMPALHAPSIVEAAPPIESLVVAEQAVVTSAGKVMFRVGEVAASGKARIVIVTKQVVRVARMHEQVQVDSCHVNAVARPEMEGPSEMDRVAKADRRVKEAAIGQTVVPVPVDV